MKFDGKRAEVDYVTHNSMTYRSVAKKYEVSLQTVKNYATKHNWVKKREEYELKVTQNCTDKQAENEVKSFTKLKTATELAIDKVYAMLNSVTDEKGIRSLVASIKDLNEIYKEQNTKTDDDENETGIAFLPDVVAQDDDNVVIEVGNE